MSLPGYDDWKTHNPDDDRCEFCGVHPTLNLKEPDMDTETHTELPTERMWCLACGTVTRDQHCDCTRMDTGTANFVNYADRLREDCRQAITEAAQLRTSHDALVAALRKIMDTAEGNECRKIARAALSPIGGGNHDER